MRQKLLFAAFGTAALAIMVFSYWLMPMPPAIEPFPPQISQKMRDKLGNDTIDVLLGATRVEAFRVDKDPDKAKGKPASETIGGFLIIGKGSEQQVDFGRKLTTVVLKDDTFFHTRSIQCYWPGVAFRLWKGDKSVEVVICFNCANLTVGMTGTPTYADRGPVRRPFGDSTNAVRAALVGLAKEAFPNDPEIQGMKRPYGCDDDGSP
jgi:hypothetical protein